MSGQKTLLSFFQKQPVTKALAECSTNIKKQVNGKKTFTEDFCDEKTKQNEVSLSKRIKLDSEEAAINASVECSKPDSDEIDDAVKLILISNETFGLVNNFGLSWFKALEQEFSKPYFLKLSQFVSEERKNFTIYPPESQVFSWTILCKLEEIKVVILGQDPYHGPDQAHGLCFSVKTGVRPPPSLLNIYKELSTDIEGFKIPQHGTLVGWASQGVLLLNACLTVRKGVPNSHKDKGWETFTDSVIKTVNERLKNVVFLLWGAYAHKKALMIDQKKHKILTCVHPSPLSASKGWFGCKHFSKANEFLIEKNKKPIDWTYLPTEDEFKKENI